MPEFVIVAEAEADARHIRSLADRIFLEEGPEWIDEALLPNLRNWSGFEPGTSFTQLREIARLTKEHKLPRYRGHINGQAQRTDYATSRKAILLAIKLQKDAVILVHDLDSQLERREGLAQAQEQAEGEITVVLATPNPKREAWVLNGFVCLGRHEERKLEALRRELELDFDPCLEAHRLRYSSRTVRSNKRDPKLVVKRLMGEDWDRKQQCWTQTPLSTLRERGVETYLTEFLDEVKDRLLRLIAGHTQS